MLNKQILTLLAFCSIIAAAPLPSSGSSLNPIPNIVGSPFDDVNGSGDGNPVVNGNIGNGDNNVDNLGSGDEYSNNFGDENFIGSGDSGIALRQTNPSTLSDTIPNLVGSPSDNLDGSGDSNSIGTGNQGNLDGILDDIGSNDGNGNSILNGNSIGSNDSLINLVKVRRQSGTACYSNSIISAVSSGAEGAVNAVPANSGAGTSPFVDVSDSGGKKLVGNTNTDDGSSNDDRFGSKQGDNNSLGNANEILSNNGGIDIDLSLTLGK